MIIFKFEKIEFEGEGCDYMLGEMMDLYSRFMFVIGKVDVGRESIEWFILVSKVLKR